MQNNKKILELEDDEAISTFVPYSNESESYSINTLPFVINNYIVRLDNDIEAPKNYRKVFDLCKTATENDFITFIINSNGGYYDTMTQLVYDIQNTRAHTIAEVHHAYSAAACITMACQEIVVTPFSSMMIHGMLYGIEGKVSDVTVQNNFVQKQNEDMLRKLFTGFLSKQEIDAILKGQDMWLYSEDILTRLEKMVIANTTTKKGKKKSESI